MLIPAMMKEKELQEHYLKCVYDERYKFAVGLNNYRTLKLEIKGDDWNHIQLISYDEISNKIIGYFCLDITRPANMISNIVIYNFKPDGYKYKLIFTNDLKHLFVKIFKEFKFIKVKFCVVIGNPIEKSYDRFIKKYNGSIVGTFKNDTLIDNEFYDVKWYEITREQFLKVVE